MSDEDHTTVLPAGSECITRPAADTDLLQIAFRDPSRGWVAVEVDRQKASKLALELQAFADFRSTADGDA